MAHDRGVMPAREKLTAALLADFWPQAEERVVSALLARGIDDATAEDAVAEAATRALAAGIEVADVDDFCRWAFVVARNVAIDAGRRSRRVVLIDAVPERADDYDLVRHIAIRDEWQHTAEALRTLSPGDQEVLLLAVHDDGSETGAHLSRREAVKNAVRRHRARMRLRAALGQAGGWLGWHLRPWVRWTPALLGHDRVVAAAAAIALLLAPTAGTDGTDGIGTSSGAGDLVAARIEEPARGAVPSADSGVAAPSASPSSASRPRSAAAQPTSIANPTRGFGFEFTPSPSYEEDQTVYAAAGERCEGKTVQGSCSLLYRSTDGGATWTQLEAVGRGFGTILLPPAYPRDPRIFSAGLSLTVSKDGGRTFQTIGPAPGAAAMSPLFSDDDPRIFFATAQFLWANAPTQYHDGLGLFGPLRLPLPAHAVPQRLSFAPDYTKTGRIVVLSFETDVVDTGAIGGETPAVRSGVNRTGVYSCDLRTCVQALDLFGHVRNVAWTADGAAYVSDAWGIYRSTDSGRSFTRLPLPGDGQVKTRVVSLIAAGARPLVTVTDGKTNGLYASSDGGRTWELTNVAEHTDEFLNMVSLPDGVILDAPQDQSGVRCSIDGARTWTRTCPPRSPSPTSDLGSHAR